MLDKVIEEIIKRLSPLKSLYQEVDPLIEDLKNHEFNSLNDFINKYYQDVFYSTEFQNFILDLTNQGLIKKDYQTTFKKENQYYRLIDFYIKSQVLLNGFKAINMTNDKFLNLKTKAKFTIKKEEIDDDTEFLSLDDNDVELIRRKLLEAQLNYLNKPTEFIETLEKMSENDIYSSLLNLGNISYIQHSLANLGIETLERLLIFIEEKENNNHNLINGFIEESIKRNLHLKKNNLQK